MSLKSATAMEEEASGVKRKEMGGGDGEIKSRFTKNPFWGGAGVW